MVTMGQLEQDSERIFHQEESDQLSELCYILNKILIIQCLRDKEKLLI